MTIEHAIDGYLSRYGFRVASARERGQFVLVEIDGIGWLRVWAVRA